MDGAFESWSTPRQALWSGVAPGDEPEQGAGPVYDVMSACAAAVPPWLSVAAARKIVLRFHFESSPERLEPIVLAEPVEFICNEHNVFAPPSGTP